MHQTSEDNVLQVEPRARMGCILVLGLLLLAGSGCSSGASDQVDSGGGGGSSSGGSGGSSSGGSSSGGLSDSGGSSIGGSSGASVTDAGAAADSGITCLWTFDDGGLGGWAFNTYQTSADPFLDADMGLDPNNLSAQGAPTLDPTVGNPPGSMMVTIPFTGYNQKADYHVAPTNFSIPDLTNKVLTLTAKLELTDDGGYPFDKSAPAGIVIYIKTGGSYIWGQAPWANITDDATKWFTYTFDVTNGFDPVNTKTGFDPSSIDEIGFFIDTGGCGVAAGATCPHPNPTTATFHIDNICIRAAPM